MHAFKTLLPRKLFFLLYICTLLKLINLHQQTEATMLRMFFRQKNICRHVVDNAVMIALKKKISEYIYNIFFDEKFRKVVRTIIGRTCILELPALRSTLKFFSRTKLPFCHVTLLRWSVSKDLILVIDL